MLRLVNVLLLPLLWLLGCSQAGAEQKRMLQELQAAAVASPVTRVEVVTLAASSASLTLQLPGEVQGWHDALLASPTGGLVEDVRVGAGDSVQRGATLVVVDREPAHARLAQAKASLAQVKDELLREEKLGDLAVQSRIGALRTRIKVAEADVSLASTQLARTIVSAPFAGTVGQVDVERGEFAQPGAPLVRLVQLDPVKVVLSVADRDVVALEQGLDVRVETPAAGTILHGTISHVAPVADLSTRSFLVEVRVPNAERKLLPGMIARVEVDRPLAVDAILLPQQYLVTKLDSYGVYVAVGETARWREVVLGDVVRGQVVVTAGLSIGDKVIITGQNNLESGDAISVAREGRCCTNGRAVYAE